MENRVNSLTIGQGAVYHTRKEGVANAFHYPTFFLQFKCSEESALHSTFRDKFFRLLSLSMAKTVFLKIKLETFSIHLVTAINLMRFGYTRYHVCLAIVLTP
jgi:hypothetical protein